MQIPPLTPQAGRGGGSAAEDRASKTPLRTKSTSLPLKPHSLTANNPTIQQSDLERAPPMPPKSAFTLKRRPSERLGSGRGARAQTGHARALPASIQRPAKRQSRKGRGRKKKEHEGSGRLRGQEGPLSAGPSPPPALPTPTALWPVWGRQPPSSFPPLSTRGGSARSPRPAHLVSSQPHFAHQERP